MRQYKNYDFDHWTTTFYRNDITSQRTQRRDKITVILDYYFSMLNRNNIL